MTLTETIRRMVAPLGNRIGNLVQRAVVRRVDDSKKLQTLQVLAAGGVVRGRVERFQQYGFTSVPVADAEAVMLSLGGLGDHVIVIAVDDRRYRLKSLAEGEVAIYADGGAKVVLKANGDVEINSGTVAVNKVGDAVTAGTTMGAWITAVTAVVNGIVPGAAVQPTDFGVTAGGSPTVKVP